MPIDQAIKELAYKIDPECWKSYSGKSLRYRQRADSRRTASLAQAEKELREDEGDAAVTDEATIPAGTRWGQTRYTVEEIDRMRAALRRNPSYGQYGRYRARSERPFEETSRHIEDILRTHMLNGSDPVDLEIAASEEWERIRERQAQRRAERDAVLRAAASENDERRANLPLSLIADRVVADAGVHGAAYERLRERVHDALASMKHRIWS